MEARQRKLDDAATFPSQGPRYYRWIDKRILDRVLLESDHLRKSQSGQELYVEDLLHGGGLELQKNDDLSAAKRARRQCRRALKRAKGQRR